MQAVCILLECILVVFKKIIITNCIAKRVKAIFAQAFVCPTRGGGLGNHGPGHNTSPPGTRSQHVTPSHHPPGQSGGMHPTGMHSCFKIVFPNCTSKIFCYNVFCKKFGFIPDTTIQGQAQPVIIPGAPLYAMRKH